MPSRTSPPDTQRKRKLSEIIAEQLMAEIKAKGWPVGQSIGTESELMKRFSVSRATIIEAARQVEGHGAAAMRRGSGGGLFILNSAPTAVSRAVSTYLELAGATIAEQYEAARIIETAAARLAAERIDEATALRLREMAAAVSDAKDGVALHSQAMKLRIAIADATGSRSLGLFMRSLARVLTNYVRPDLRSHYRDLAFEHGVAADMWALVEAVVAGDAALADSHSRVDVERRERRARVLAVAHPMLEVGPLRRETPNKLGEQVALTIRDDIARSGWRVGEWLANEADLPGRYGSSQWIVRQAIRLLELHGIVTMRRGQGGGLFVGEPSPDYTIDLAASFFDAGGDLSVSGVLEIRRHLLKNIARLAAIRGSNEDARALSAVSDASGGSPHAAFVLQLGLAGRNRVLSLFASILDRFVADGDDARAAPDEAALRAAVCEAIETGDAPLARRRMHAYCGAV